MNKYKKKEMLKMINTLEKANISINKNSFRATSINITQVLTQCQETAILLGTYLDSLGNETKDIVQILEIYCENIYQLSLTISDSRKTEKLSKKIKVQLVQIYNKIKQEIPEDKKEIIFLPYKASMWDSLESIWEAAIKDATCEVYVVPLPYYDKNADGTNGQIHYEGQDYPNNVPITSWEDYYFEEHLPDITYIHNPYDDSNYVTSVPSRFYAGELKKYTKLLIYVPYFVAVNDILGSYLCVLPGILYADKVIVQSEKVRIKYIEELQKFEEENKCKDTFGKIEEKIVALGSPKYDKLLMMQEKKQVIPAEWTEAINKKNGRNKKIILYNTTISGMLENTERKLEKIQSVISYFAKEEEILLLWRPHPLLSATLHAMRSPMHQKYIEIVNAYKNKKIGIYDESADLHRAISLADIYYGDYSSVADLFINTGKPVMFQTDTISGFDLGLHYMFLIGMSVYKDSIYATLHDRNGIVKIDLRCNTIHYLDKIPNRPMDASKLYHFTKIYEDKMYYIPFTDSRLLIYDFKKKEYDEIDLDLKNEFDGGEGFFYNCHIYNTTMFLFPFRYRAIICVDLETKEIIKLIDLREVLPIEENSMLFSGYELIDDTHAVLPTLSNNKLLIIDLINFTIEIFSVGEEGYCFSSIVKYKEDFWLVVKNKLLFIKWNFETKKIQVMGDLNRETTESYVSFFDAKGIILHKKWLYCFPARFDAAVKINLDTGEQLIIEELEPYCKHKKIDRRYSVFDGCAKNGDKVYLHYQVDASMLVYDLESGKISVFKREFTNSDEEDRRMKWEFIDGLCKDAEKIRKTKQELPIAGREIEEYVIGLLEE